MKELGVQLILLFSKGCSKFLYSCLAEIFSVIFKTEGTLPQNITENCLCFRLLSLWMVPLIFTVNEIAEEALNICECHEI